VRQNGAPRLIRQSAAGLADCTEQKTLSPPPPSKIELLPVSAAISLQMREVSCVKLRADGLGSPAAALRSSETWPTSRNTSIDLIRSAFVTSLACSRSSPDASAVTRLTAVT